MEYPRILLISPVHIYYDTNQTSITINSYIEKWPKERIAQIITSQFNMPHGVDVRYDNTFILNNSDICFLRHICSTKREARKKVDERIPVIAKNISLILKIKMLLYTSFTQRQDLFKYILSDDMISFAKKFSPNIIYCVPYDYRSMRLAFELSHALGVKIIPHFMDDWPTTINNFPFTKLQRAFVINYLRKFLSYSSCCLCISDYMCEEFEYRYGLQNCQSLMNCIDRYHGEEKRIKKGGIITISYAGTLSLQRDKTIIKFYNLLINYHQFPFEIIIYTTSNQWVEHGSQFHNCPGMKYGGYIAHDKIIDVYKKSDILLHVESFDESIKKFTRFSISTKIPEYLSSGTLIIAIGPPDIASIKYLIDNKAAIVIADLEDDSLYQNLSNSFIDDERRDTILNNAKNLFIKNHLKANQVNKLVDTINRAIGL